jgi:hypothetical protein
MSQEGVTVFIVCEQDYKLDNIPGLKFQITISGIKLYKPLELKYSNVTGSTVLQGTIRQSSGLRQSTKNKDFFDRAHIDLYCYCKKKC